MAQTPTAELIGIKLGVADLTTWVAERRADGLSYGRIAAEVYSQTGVYVSGQTLRNWHEPVRAAS